MWLVVAWTALLPVQVPLIVAGGTGRDVNFAPSDAVLVLAVLLVGGSLRMRREMWSAWHFALPILFAASIVLGGALTRYALANKLLGMLVLLGSYLMITSFVRTWRDVRLVLTVLVASVVVVNAVSLAAEIADVDLPLRTCHAAACLRLTGFLPDSNLYGSLIVVTLAIYLALSGRRSLLMPEISTGKLAQLLIAGSLVVGLALTLSRSAWLALALVVVGLLTLRPRRAVAIIAFSLAVVVAATLAAPDVLISTSLRTQSIESRFVLIDQGLDSFNENPAVGIGLGNFPMRHGQIIHNTPLWFAAEMGLVGLVVFFGFAVWILRRVWRSYRLSVGPTKLIAGAVLMGNLAMVVFSAAVEALYQRHWWLLMALGVVGDSLSRRDAGAGRRGDALAGYTG